MLPSCQFEREEDRLFEFVEERAERKREKDNENYEIMREEREEPNRLKNNFWLYHCATFRMVLQYYGKFFYKFTCLAVPLLRVIGPEC